MSHRPGGENPISKFFKGLNKQGSAIARGGPVVIPAFLVLLVVLLILCLLIFSSDILSFDTNLLEKVQNVRLTLNPYTPTPTVTPTKKPTHTLTPTITLTPTGKQPSPTSTPRILTPTFIVTATPTKPTIPLRTLRADSFYQLEERLTDSWLWRHIYAILVGVALASWFVVLYIRDVYSVQRSIRSAGLLVRMLFLLPIGTIHIRGGNLVDVVVRKVWIEDKDEATVRPDGKIERKYKQDTQEVVRIVRKDWVLTTPQGKIVYKNNRPAMANALRRTMRLLRVGLPARLIVERDSCAVIEGSQKQALVIGQTDGPVILLGFSRLRRAVDLRDTPVKLSVRQPTKDGVPLSAEDVQFIFSVYRGEPTVPDAAYLYNEQAIFNLVYRFWLDGEWLPEMKARIAAELRQFIAAHPLNTFLPHLSQNQASAVNLSQSVNPFNAFVNEFNAQAPGRGIQIQWQGDGKWKLPTEADLTEQLENWQKNIENLLNLPEQFPGEPAGGEYNQNLIDLIQQVPMELLDPLMPPNVISTRAMLKVIEAYRDKLNQTLQLYRESGQSPPSELVEVIDHLNRLILRRIGGS